MFEAIPEDICQELLWCYEPTLKGYNFMTNKGSNTEKQFGEPEDHQSEISETNLW